MFGTMADSSNNSGQSKPADRRSFLKVGAGVVAGAAVASVAGIAYYDSVIGSNNSSSSSTVASLQGQLASANSQLSSTQAALSSAQGQVTSLNGQLTATQSQLSNANNQLAAANSQLTSVSGQLSSTQSSLTSANSQISSLNGQVSTLNQSLTTANSQITALAGNADALLTLGVQEAAVVEAAAEAIIPTDSNGPGAKEAGVIYFIDRQLFGDYGSNGKMYNKGPFIMPNAAGPLTVNSPTGPITYTGGSPNTPWASGQSYGYAMSLRNFWAAGIQALEAYSNSAYGANFETLTVANQAKCLGDLFNNKPTTFNSIIPSDFANELFFMVWAGFLMDPMYGGNRGMVGWTLTASPGLNSGNFYGEGQTPKARMVSPTPSVLKPASLAQFQQANGVAGVHQGGT